MKVTIEDIAAQIESEHYFTAADGLVGAQADNEPLDIAPPLGQSACADPAEFDAGLGQRIAKQDAIGKAWPLLGYELRTRLSNA